MGTDHTPAPQAPADGRRIISTLVVAVAAAMQVIVAVPFTMGTGLVAPLWGIVVAWALWLAGAAVLVFTARRRPLVTPVVPVINAGLLWLLITIGEQAFGWSA